MYFTEPLYRNPYWPTWPLIQITQGCTHNTSSMNLTGPDFLKRKPQILEALRYGIEHLDMDELTQVRQNKRTL